MASAQCTSCGAPDDGELVTCKYCRQPVSAEAQASAIPCPRCRALCRWGKQKCGACQSWIVVACVFCGAISPHNQQACLRCREPFAGAPARKQAMQQQRANAETMQTLGVVGNIAASFLGAAAGSVVVNHGHSSWGDSSFGDYGGDSSSDSWVDNTDEGPPEWSNGGDDFGSSDDGGFDE